MSGPKAQALLKHLESVANWADDGRAYTEALGELRAAAEAAARQRLRGWWTGKRAEGTRFANHSLLLSVGAGALKGQAGHTDVSFESAQCLVGLTPTWTPTRVYGTPIDFSACRTLEEAQRQAQTPLLLPRAELERRMVSGGHYSELELGDMITIIGECIHAGPATAEGEDRGVLFFTVDDGAYDPDSQNLPWVVAYSRNDYDAFCRVCTEYADHRPWENFRGALTKEVERVCRGQKNSLRSHFQ